jgi:thioredoxin-dependent peroxiredoxin
MPAPIVGKKAPDFELPAADGSTFRLSDHKGTPVVLYFYPQDDTEGCTLENQEFSALRPEFEALGAVIAGISPDSIDSHCKFRDKFGLSVPLLADTDLKVAKKYGLWQLKKLWGVEYMGLVRTSFLIDRSGKVAGVFKATRIRDHAAKLLDATRALAC